MVFVIWKDRLKIIKIPEFLENLSCAVKTGPLCRKDIQETKIISNKVLVYLGKELTQ